MCLGVGSGTRTTELPPPVLSKTGSQRAVPISQRRKLTVNVRVSNDSAAWEGINMPLGVCGPSGWLIWFLPQDRRKEEFQTPNPQPQSGFKGSSQSPVRSRPCLPNLPPGMRQDCFCHFPWIPKAAVDRGATWRTLRTPGPSRHWSWSRRPGRGCWGHSPRHPPPRSPQTAPRC